MKKSELIMLSFVAGIIVFCMPSYAVKPSTPRYTVTQPYQYPVVPGMAEWKGIDSVKDCRVPDKLISQMTTKALLETVLTHPLIDTLFMYSTPSGGFSIIKDTYHCGLAELMARADLAQVIYERYIELDYVYEDILRWGDDVYSYETITTVFSKEWTDWHQIKYLEAFAVQMKLDEGGKAHARLLREINRRHAYYIARNGFRENIDTISDYGATSVYYWNIQKDNMRNRFFR